MSTIGRGRVQDQRAKAKAEAKAKTFTVKAKDKAKASAPSPRGQCQGQRRLSSRILEFRLLMHFANTDARAKLFLPCSMLTKKFSRDYIMFVCDKCVKFK